MGEPESEKKELILALGFRERAKGLLFTPPHQKTLMLCPCRSVHTFGMRYALDIAFVNGDGRVVASYRRVAPKQRLRHGKARAVLERFSVEEDWFEEGARVSIVSALDCY